MGVIPPPVVKKAVWPVFHCLEGNPDAVIFKHRLVIEAPRQLVRDIDVESIRKTIVAKTAFRVGSHQHES